MSTLYVILAVVIASIIAFSTFVVIGSIEKHKHININWMLLMLVVILSCSLAMVVIYHSENDLTLEDTKEAYDNGYEAGVASEHHTIPNNEEMENWFSSTQKVVVGTNEGGDTAIHIIDGNGDEWVLYADSIQTK